MTKRREPEESPERAAPARDDAQKRVERDYPYFANTACAYFPCHEGADPDNFNCLFCFCPLYTLGEACGGDFSYTAKGVKDCTKCLVPHRRNEGTKAVYAKFPLLKEMAARKAPELDASESEASEEQGEPARRSDERPAGPQVAGGDSTGECAPGFAHYVSVGGKRLRCGYTTGTCAAAAARGAAEALLAGSFPCAVRMDTPAGLSVAVDLEEAECGAGWARCAVRKDAGDDPDVTDGALVFARVSASEEPGVRIDGGLGVGRVTRAGLDQPVGAAAINRVPREMIAAQVRAAAEAAGYEGGLDVEISIPAGVELAARTFNPRLGIEGGISVLGTSGVVRPMSEEALVASIQLEMRMRFAEGVRHLLVSPGNYGSDFARDQLGCDLERGIQCSNFIGATIDYAVQQSFESLLIVGHAGKLVKVAAGVMNTHSRVSDARNETLAAHAALAGAPAETVRAVMGCATTDAAADALADAGVLAATMGSLVAALEERLKQRAGTSLRVEAVVFSLKRGLLGKTSDADRLLALHRLLSNERTEL